MSRATPQPPAAASPPTTTMSRATASAAPARRSRKPNHPAEEGPLAEPRTPTEPSAALQALQAAARRTAAARRLHGDVEQSLLQTVVDAAVSLFDAEAASIALFERDPDRLEFRVASGVQGAGVVGLSVPTSKGIVGYVFSTGQAIALSDVMSDPALRPGHGQAHRLRAALHRRGAADRPADAGRRAPGPGQALDGHLHAQGHGADGRLRAPGRGGHRGHQGAARRRPDAPRGAARGRRRRAHRGAAGRAHGCRRSRSTRTRASPSGGWWTCSGASAA